MEPVCKEKATRVQYELHFKKPEKKNGGGGDERLSSGKGPWNVSSPS